MSKNEREVIGDYIELRFTNLPSSSFLRGKVDTGATICSLHCDGHQINEQTGQITFKCSHLSANSITVPLADRQAVKTADNGTEYRPVIEMSVKVGENVIDNVKFNLNDRSKMDCPILIGQNLIKEGNFLIDPKKQVVEKKSDDQKNVDKDNKIEHSVEVIFSTEPETENNKESVDAARREKIDAVYQMMRVSDITLRELLDYAESYRK